MTGSLRFLHLYTLICTLATFVTISSPRARAAILIPKQLTSSDRDQALRIVGFGTSAKVLSDPFPLGGYTGFEFGLSVETLPTDDLGRLGARLTSPQQDVSFPKFTIGKGLYNDVDLFVQFTPYNRLDELSQFGGIARWGFYQSKTLPVSASLQIHMNSGNIGNSITTRSYGGDLIAGMNVDSVAVFAGAGLVQASGTFAGGVNGVTDSGKFESQTVTGLKTIVGLNIRIFEKGFVAGQMDRSTVSAFSVKAGLRF